MANPEHLEILKQGVKAWNEWREENPEIRSDLREAVLSLADLSGAKLFEANLIGISGLESARGVETVRVNDIVRI